ncbi:MAG TPA: DUF2905 domain-containing protein [Pseudothermotoga sp.]|nr:DUF2905 domain-containing protein [Pseudothermotoga sp.]HOK83515.1 DUF2905 domain-containing protein [Pseudothermotoga sp.]HPP69588.1 DUF2905 domain-containing protein [Pseudothermotoga sp.]
MLQVSKLLILIGLVLVVIGTIIYLLGRFTPLGRLPGDIVIKREKFILYFPLMTCLLISAVLSLIFFLISKFGK